MPSREPSPFGENDRWATADAAGPTLAGPPPFQARSPMYGSSVVAFGGFAGATNFDREDAVAIHAPRNAGRTTAHSVIGPVTWYQVKPSATRGPPTIASTVPAATVATRGALEAGAARTERRPADTAPKPPTARREGVIGRVPA